MNDRWAWRKSECSDKNHWEGLEQHTLTVLTLALHSPFHTAPVSSILNSIFILFLLLQSGLGGNGQYLTLQKALHYPSVGSH